MGIGFNNQTHDIMIIEVGQKVPTFELLDQDEKPVTDVSLQGKRYILFFYPKDDSPGCTKEACSIRDNYKKIQKEGFEVYGISPDKTSKHRKFIDKYEFQYDLLADPEKETIKKFGLWGPKKFMGKEITGVYRTTLFVDEEGLVTHIIDKVKTKEHGEQILSVLQEMKVS